jgi:hypothetical protein
MTLNTNANLDPVLHYKLDPGEWGSSAPSSAALSIGRVSQHEADNIGRFKKEALQKGCYVVQSSVSLNISKQGEYLAATSGKSQAIIYCPNKNKLKNTNNDDNNSGFSPLSIYDNQINQLKEQEKYTQDPKQKEKIDQQIQALKLQRQTLKAILQYVQNNTSKNSLDLTA